MNSTRLGSVVITALVVVIGLVATLKASIDRSVDAEAMLPAAAGRFAPSHLSVARPEGLDTDLLSAAGRCASCHAEIVEQWRHSAHALASFNNPYYRVSVERYQGAVGFEESRFCGGCHDPALVTEGAMDESVQPDDRRAHAGVGCAVCHGVTETRPDGNASVTLTTEPIVLPVEGDADSLARHIERVAPAPLRTAGLCVSCHRGFLGPETGNAHFLVGIDDGSDWGRSIYGGTGLARLDEPLSVQTCIDCHMAPVDGLASHRFAGAHTALASALRPASPSADAQLEAIAERLRTAVRVDIAAVRWADGRPWLPADGAPVEPGDTLELDVVVRNVGAGHRFPAGTLDLQDAWLELDVRTADGQVLAQAGARHEASGEDPTAHVFRAHPIDTAGRAEYFHVVSHFRAIAWNTTIPAREAAVVRYVLKLPAELAERQLPLGVTARLRHRRHRLAFQEAACADTRTERGLAFDSASQVHAGVSVDPCQSQPVLELGRSEVTIGAPATPMPGAAPTWQRLYDHALGLAGGVQERLDEARPSLERALEEARRTATPHDQAMVLVLLAEVEGLQGRTDEALARLDEAEALAGHAAPIDFRRGEALAQVWRWSEAADAYAEVVLSTPQSYVAWQRYATALVSLGRWSEALDAAQRGLALQPRDSALLLAQAMALEGLDAAPPVVLAARSAYLRHRPDDAGPASRSHCYLEVPGCANERVPIHTHELVYR